MEHGSFVERPCGFDAAASITYRNMTDLDTYVYVHQLAIHFDAIIFWLASDQPALLPRAAIAGDAEDCDCGLRH